MKTKKPTLLADTKDTSTMMNEEAKTPPLDNMNSDMMMKDGMMTMKDGK